MEIRHLEYFIEVARYMNYSRAAENIHISQPTLSRSIIELEEELGHSLFIRSKRELTLTRYGENFLLKAKNVVQAFTNLAEPNKTTNSFMEVHIYIGVPPITAATGFTGILGKFYSNYPHIKITLFERGPKQLEKMLLDGLLDFGIFKPNNAEKYIRHWFESDTHSVLLPQGHPLSAQATLTYQDLAGYPLVIYNADYNLHDKIMNGFENANVVPTIALESSQQDMMILLVESKLALSILPTKCCQRVAAHHSSITAHKLEDENLTMKLALNRLKAQKLSLAAQVFEEFFCKQTQK